MLKWLVKNIIRPQWVSFEYHDGKPGANELGLSIFGVVVGYYKAETIYPYKAKNIREPEKREFGESLHPRGYYPQK